MDPQKKRLLILSSKLGYQAQSFARAAGRLGVEVIFGTDRCHQLEDPWRDAALPLHFDQAAAAAQSILHSAQQRPIDAILALGDQPTLAAALASRALGLVYNSPQSAEACRTKLRQREVLRAGGLPVPDFFSFSLAANPLEVLQQVNFPCVIKPLSLSASQGVIRANNQEEFTAAVRRIAALLNSPELQVTHAPDLDRLLVETYIPGIEVAVEGLLEHGRLRILAIFDKPDPLEGPYFEETIYVTPSRLPPETQKEIADCAQRAATALGLTHGPLHAEFRIAKSSTGSLVLWILELQPRPIGGLCARVLRFGPDKIPLEELLVKHALGVAASALSREEVAAGVMMIPVPHSGILESVEGIEGAQSVPTIESVEITARLRDYVAAWPEGSSYLGFIFARSKEPAEVESALRAAHQKLQFTLSPRLPVSHPVTGRLPALT
jgi:formate-dependent phosphoribosylglycinamide formyltransferase (GAR transformylase)